MAYEVFSIGDRAWRIEDDKMVNCLLFEGADRALLADTGNSGDDLLGVVKKLTSKPIFLVNTHADGDHIAANGQFEEAHMLPSEFMYYAENEISGKTPSVPIWDGDVVDLGGRKFEVISIPGHTYGSVALLDKENRVLIAGDSISATPIFMFGRMRNIHAYIASMKRLLKYENCIEAIYPGHGPSPLPFSQIANLIGTAEKLTRGELEGVVPPEFPFPAKVYSDGKGSFFAD